MGNNRYIVNGCTGEWCVYEDKNNIYSNITNNTVIQTAIVVVYATDPKEALAIGIEIHEKWLRNVLSNRK